MSAEAKSYLFKKPFRGATGTDPFPVRFDEGDECPTDLVEAALEAGVVEEIDASSSSGDDINSMSKAKLEALAAERGVDISNAKTKADIIAALEAAKGE